MLINADKSVMAHLFKRRALQNAAVSVQVFKHLRFQHHESRVNPTAVLACFLPERCDRTGRILNIQHAEPASRLNRRQCDRLTGRLVRADKRVKINIADAVAIGEHKRLVPDILLNPLYAAARLCVQPRVDYGHAPRLRHIVVDDKLVVVGKIKGYIGPMQVIIGEIFLDHMALIAAADDKIIVSVIRINFHDMPQNRSAADFNHRLWTQVAFLRYARSKAARQNNNFHVSSLFHAVSETTVQNRAASHRFQDRPD